MKWNKYTIETKTEAEDEIISLLMSLGIEGVEIEDDVPLTKKELEAMFVDPDAKELMPDTVQIEEGARISFYLRITEDEDSETLCIDSSDTVDASYTIHDKLWSNDEIKNLLIKLHSGLKNLSKRKDIGSGIITTDSTEQSEWIDKWKDYYKPMLVSNILIIPYWEEIPGEYQSEIEQGKIHVVKLNPGSAFGSGSHETTRLCVDGIRKYLNHGDKMIDIGAGSGILGFSALCNGASHVYSVELDPACKHIMAENMKLNDVDDKAFEIGIGNILEDEKMKDDAGSDYDILVANILAPVTVTLSKNGMADSLVKKGGFFITSGIARHREGEVLSAFANNDNWKIIDKESTDDWTLLVAERL